ncbi:uncharacterized protein LOC131610683 [Vicia villosa]|uniref:uncharacterized protein LOC131610683 n=1 Tax=Vicia villosa TaxID=3911 RepID=UPI00273AC2E7|nr:uncharacterized protein LOC131610683 [Vicia villosa]
MRCFLPCFSASKSKRQNHFSAKPAVNANDIIQQNPVLEESIHWISSESKEKATNTKENNEEQECSDSLFSVSIGRGKSVSTEQNASETEVNSTPMKLHPAKEVSGSTPIVPVKDPEPKQNSKGKDRRVNQSLLEYRYRDCYDDDDGYDDINLDDDDDDSHGEKTEKGSSESSLFSISTDFSNRKRISFSSTEKLDNEVTSKMVALKEDDDEVLSVLNPIENVSQGKVKEVKAKLLNPIKKDKENINRSEEKTSLKVSLSSKRKMKEEIGVDTSLSDWLVESENKDDIGKRVDVEDRLILRALTVEEIRKCSSVSKTSNKCVKDGNQDLSSTTIKTRLEPAFEASVEN